MFEFQKFLSRKMVFLLHADGLWKIDIVLFPILPHFVVTGCAPASCVAAT